MGRGGSEIWDGALEDTVQTQPKKQEEEKTTPTTKSSGKSCPKCCLQTRKCLMSAECGRALQISSVVAMCGMCIRMFNPAMDFRKSFFQAALILSKPQHTSGDSCQMGFYSSEMKSGSFSSISSAEDLFIL
ncbi:hypothetical protein FQN60_002921 [Etheostoma spectabile]|uniref:Uncharacterized protein n=1 Tax=Etheostoma spectabile TaxID=54343 RepID=A0A5J5CLZ9_9PERO|nr:hypothetical protein FQN60_002921 [Etheostoma spectabile]